MKQLICSDDSKSQYCDQNVYKNCKNVCWIVGDDYCNKKTCPYSSFRSKICKNGQQKLNLCEKLGKEHLDCKKSTLAKSQPSKKKVNRWRQQVEWRWCKQVTLARADVAVMTLVGNHMGRVDQLHWSWGWRVRARGLFDDADSFPKMQIGERRFWWCCGNKIGATLVVREVRGIICRNFD